MSVTFVAGVLAVRRRLFDKLMPSNNLITGLQLPNALAGCLYCTLCGMFRPADLEQVHGGHVLTDAAVDTEGGRMICQPFLRHNAGR